ncbi:MAG TPA: hypothetical protein VGR62_16700 [Candidatus Binatia bacterium]|jgi:hypothetical protein|nr:hypothetical protein [Candidatus Binatia bacterium]
MRRLQLLVLVALCLTPALALLADETASPPPAPTQSTVIEGTVPDLAGHWLVVADLVLPQDSHLNVAHFWDVTIVDGKPSIESRQVGLPPEVRASLEAANQARVTWKITPEQLAAVSAAWTTLPPEDRGMSKIEHKIIGKDAFDEMIKNEEFMKDSLWVVQQSGDFRPNEGRPVRDALLWGGVAPTEDGYTGAHMSVAVAAAPFPIPIAFKGSFRMYRLDPSAQRGFLARMMDVFAGCGRTR